MERLETVTFIIIAVTSLVSWAGFRDPRWVDKGLFRPESILAHKEYYRLLTPAFLHADWQHLLFNMFSLYFFGNQIERIAGVQNYLLIYFGSVLGGNLLSLWIHRHHDYGALGASGGVCGVIFASIFLSPGGHILIFPFPFGIPAWLYAIIFLLASFYGLKAQRDNIGHDAHLGGAICGLLITAGLYPRIIEMSPKLFATVLGISILLMVYLIMNPMLLPVASFWRSRSRRERRGSFRANSKTDHNRVNKLLDKISRQGLDSLTDEEREFLKQASGQYRDKGGD